MRLALSNLALKGDPPVDYLRRLASMGVAGIEVAPTRVAAWQDLDDEVLNAYRDKVESAGLVVSSLQALLYGINDAHLLRDEAAFEMMRAHLQRVARAGARLGAGVGVFGSPRNRQKGEMDADEAWALGRARFRALAETVADEGFSLGLEPVPAFYGGDFVETAEAVIEMVRQVDHPGLRIHLDTGCVTLGGGDIGAAIDAAGSELGHFHIAEPKLAGLRHSVIDHAAAAAGLARQKYDKWVAIEMLEPADGSDEDVFYSVEFAIATYFRQGIVPES